MMRLGKSVLSAAIGLLSTVAVHATTSGVQGSPYEEIVERNVFRLSAPVVSIAAPLTKPIALPKIALTGIITILGRRIAFITVAGVKPGEAAESFMLAEGQAVNDVEVKNIDDRAGIVRIVNHGESQILDFDRDGVKTSDPGHDPREQPFPRLAPPPLKVNNAAPLTPEEQVALIEIQRVKYQQENDPIRNILPPTEMTPETGDNY